VPSLAPDAAAYEDWLALFAYEVGMPVPVTEVGSETQGEVTIRDITFPSPYGDDVPAYLIAPPGEGPFPAVLYVHWYETQEQATSNRTEFLEEAVSLAGEGVASLLVDDVLALPGPRERWSGLDAENDRELVIRQVVELRRAADVLIAEGRADPSRLAFVGHDFGAMFGAVLLPVDGRFKTAVLLAMVGDFADWFLLGSPLGGPDRDAYREGLLPVAPLQYLPHFTPASVFFQFADNDAFVGTEDADGLLAAASEPKRAETYASDHALHENAVAASDRLAWLRQELGVGD
jgi:acetyl esterase/lipase